MRARYFSFSILSRKEHRNTTRPSQLKEHSTPKSLCRGTKNRSDMAPQAPSSRVTVFVLPRAATWYRLCEAKQRTLPRAAAAHNRHPALESYWWKYDIIKLRYHLLFAGGVNGKKVLKSNTVKIWIELKMLWGSFNGGRLIEAMIILEILAVIKRVIM
jgi:hypothetical protein